MRLCSIDDCGRKHVAKGLCANHYNQTHYTSEQRHAKRMLNCEACGTEVLRYPNGGRYRVTCSEPCRYLITYGKTKEQARAERRPVVALVGPLPKARSFHPVAIAGAVVRFLSVECKWCGTAFIQDRRVTGVQMRYCTNRCQRAAAKRLRKAREHGASGTYTLAELVRLWLAFDKCCAYCEQPTDGLPDPDHVNPLSRGGSNSITNILPACSACNSDKNDMTLDEWSRDRVRRGKPARVTAWTVGDRRVSHLVMADPTRASRVSRLAS